MAEILQKDGTWTFDGDTVRVVPGSDKGVSLLRKTLGEVAVPLDALAGISYEPGKKSGRLRLRLRNGADPLLQITGGKLEDSSDPYRLTVENDRSGVAEYFVDEVRNALLLDQVGTGPVDRYLLSGPALPITVGAGDGTATFDGERIRLEWNWKTEESKSSGGARTLALEDVESVEWLPSVGLEIGYLRFAVAKAPTKAPPKYDPHAVELWGFRKDPLMALVGAAVVARMPHPYAPALVEAVPWPALSAPAAPAPTPGDDHDALLRRLRELGELHQSGILTAEEFTTAKQAILKRL
ncbi:Tat pathway signal sequence domain protein [Streptomyces lunaelactis]|uniref:Tat pathway signal sequence domain protein n=1 Tax=Streptomyces lunaelactis TaxID=1535768 RepID=A0A2R4T212_9ACTN|nr:DUF4429 domain-containing protein [Streptomyces lunaelactis]AVZ73178.1 Tat pathway signal sequence domain protein [Streptomyces lunaelactis]NUK89815.1 DUF4429 domain-containing protein [Streptomyces lunaelactis]